MLRAVVFDIGGVLTNDAWEPMFFDAPGNLAEAYGLDVEDLKLFMREIADEFGYKRPGDSCAENANRLEAECWARVIARLKLPVSPQYLARLSRGFVEKTPHMEELLRDLNEHGVMLAICSNNTEFWFRNQNEFLGLKSYIHPSRIILSCRVGAYKDSSGGEMFKAVIHALEFPAEECVLVDDRGENIERALRFGMGSVLFPRSAWYGADYLRTLFSDMGLLLEKERRGV